MRFQINRQLIAQVRPIFQQHKRLFWIVGGAGSGKSTISSALAERTGIPIYDMDAHIYGDYHERFTPDLHPVNYAWAAAENGLAWLLNLSWSEFDTFNRAALPEYLALLAEDLHAFGPQAGLIVDGGICNPALLAQVLAARQIVCLAGPERSSAEVWEGDTNRLAMKDLIQQLPAGVAMWRRFLDFDKRITQTILRESGESGIAICARSDAESVELFAERVAAAFHLH